MEEWKAVRGYEGYYEISSNGSLKSLARKGSDGRQLKEKTLRSGLNKCGYLSVSIFRDGIQKTHNVHQLVAIAFLGHEPNGRSIVVDHIDNDKLNNAIDNLQLITHRENLSKDKKGGSSKYVGVSWHKVAKKWHAQITTNSKINYLGLFTEELEAHEAYQSALTQLA